MTRSPLGSSLAIIPVMVSVLFMTILPAYAQSTMNKSEHLDSVEVPFDAFNVASHNATLFNLQHEHATNWQLEIQNKLTYANPNGNAIIRLYDTSSKEKFIEIGMGSPPDYKFWVAVNTAADGYFVIHPANKIEGWAPNQVITVTHSSNSGLSVSVSQKVMVSDLDVAGFTVRDFGVYGMGSPTDPPATSSGSVVLNFISGNPAGNPLFYFPTVLLVGFAALIIILLKTKKRL